MPAVHSKLLVCSAIAVSPWMVLNGHAHSKAEQYVIAANTKKDAEQKTARMHHGQAGMETDTTQDVQAIWQSEESMPAQGQGSVEKKVSDDANREESEQCAESEGVASNLVEKDAHSKNPMKVSADDASSNVQVQSQAISDNMHGNLDQQADPLEEIRNLKNYLDTKIHDLERKIVEATAGDNPENPPDGSLMGKCECSSAALEARTEWGKLSLQRAQARAQGNFEEEDRLTSAVNEHKLMALQCNCRSGLVCDDGICLYGSDGKCATAIHAEATGFAEENICAQTVYQKAYGGTPAKATCNDKNLKSDEDGRSCCIPHWEEASMELDVRCCSTGTYSKTFKKTNTTKYFCCALSGDTSWEFGDKFKGWTDKHISWETMKTECVSHERRIEAYNYKQRKQQEKKLKDQKKPEEDQSSTPVK